MDEIIHQLSNKFLRSLSSSLSKATKQNTEIYCDPSLQIVLHLISCTRTLCDMFEMNTTNGDSKTNTNSNVSMQIFQPVINGILALLGKLLMDSFTFEPKVSEVKVYSEAYDLIGKHILTLFPEMATKKHKTTGKMLIHHAVFKAKPSIAEVAVNQILRVAPISASSIDSSGALPIHWATKNPDLSIEVINSIVKTHPQSPMTKDSKGYLPLHWAVNQDNPNLELIRTLLKLYPQGASESTFTGDLPLHYCVCRMRPSIPLIKVLLDINPEAIRIPCHVEGYLPLHRFLHRPLVDLEVLTLLLHYYPEALTTMSRRNQSPLHIALDNQIPDAITINLLLDNDHSEGICELQDADGYLPLHLILDCSAPNFDLARKLLRMNFKGASHASRDHMLPLHILVGSCNNPDLEFAKQLVYAYPDALRKSVKDIIPAVNGLAMADQDSWSGEWVETAWTPSSRAKDRGLKSLGLLFDEMYIEMQTQPASFATKASHSNLKIMDSNTFNQQLQQQLTGNEQSSKILKNTVPLSNTNENLINLEIEKNLKSQKPNTLPSSNGIARELPPHIAKARLKVQSANGSRGNSPSQRDTSPDQQLKTTIPNNNTMLSATVSHLPTEVPAHILRARKQVQSASSSRDPSPSNSQQLTNRGPPSGPIPTSLLQAANRQIRYDSASSKYPSEQSAAALMSPGDIIRNLSAKSRPQSPNTIRPLRTNHAWDKEKSTASLGGTITTTSSVSNNNQMVDSSEKRPISAKQSRLIQAQLQYIKRIGKYTAGSSTAVAPFSPTDDPIENDSLLDTSIPSANRKRPGLGNSFGGGSNNIDDMV